MGIKATSFADVVGLFWYIDDSVDGRYWSVFMDFTDKWDCCV